MFTLPDYIAQILVNTSHPILSYLIIIIRFIIIIIVVVVIIRYNIIQWRRKVPKSVCVCVCGGGGGGGVGGGTQTRNLCTFGKEPI